MVNKKAILVLGFVLFGFISLAFAGDILVESRVSQVTVYPDSALITRSASLKLNPGEYKATFSNIIPEIDENSLKVSAEGSNEVKLFSAKVKREYLEEVPSEKVKQLKEEIQKLEDELYHLGNVKKMLLEEKAFLDSIRFFSGEQFSKDLVTKSPNVKDLSDTLKFLDTKLQENYSAVMDCEFKARDLGKKIDALRRQLNEISGSAKKMQRSIEVELEAVKPANIDLQVSYLVRGAFWQPIYDARSSFDKSQVELVSYGIVRQTTGEDWSEVDVSLSTARPAIGGRMPYVAPWFLRAYQRAMMRGGLRQTADNMGEQFAAFESSAKALPEKSAAGAPQYATPQERGISVVYKVPRKVTVKSDGSEHKLPVSSQNLSAKFEYSSFPRAVLNAYLGSRVSNAKNLQLPAGRVNIFLEGDFVGTSSIDNIGPAEEFDLYLGADENVKVKRDQIEKKVDDVLLAGIPSPTIRTTFKYKLTVENYKSKKIHVKLFESMPVSQDEKIKVKITSVSLEPKEKDWQDRKGVWKWELDLEPKQKLEIFYTFSVEHGRDIQVEGLSSSGVVSAYGMQMEAYSQ